MKKQLLIFLAFLLFLIPNVNAMMDVSVGEPIDTPVFDRNINFSYYVESSATIRFCNITIYWYNGTVHSRTQNKTAVINNSVNYINQTVGLDGLNYTWNVLCNNTAEQITSDTNATIDIVGCGYANTNKTYNNNVTFIPDGSEECIQLNASNLVIDGAGYTISSDNQSMGLIGLNGASRNNITIRNFRIYNFLDGLMNDFESATNWTIYNNYIYSDMGAGGIFASLTNSTIYNNSFNAKGGSINIYLLGDKITFYNNTITNNDKSATYFKNVNNLNFSYNNISLTDGNMGVWIESGKNNTIHNNLINGFGNLNRGMYLTASLLNGDMNTSIYNNQIINVLTGFNLEAQDYCTKITTPASNNSVNGVLFYNNTLDSNTRGLIISHSDGSCTVVYPNLQHQEIHNSSFYNNSYSSILIHSLKIKNSGNNTFINESFEGAISIDSEYNNTLINTTFDVGSIILNGNGFTNVYFWLNTLVLNQFGSAIPQANVIIKNLFDEQISNQTTGTDGLTSKELVLSAFGNGDGIEVLFPFNATATSYYGAVNSEELEELLHSVIDGEFNITISETLPLITINNTNYTHIQPNSNYSLNYTIEDYYGLEQINYSINDELFEIVESENISYPNYYCYQESAITSNKSGTDSCDDLLYNGSESSAQASWVDGNWETGNNGNSNLYVYYTKPSNVLSAIWRIKDYGGETNLTIPDACFNYYLDVLPLRMYDDEGNDDNWWYCWDEGWTLLRRQTANNIMYEEGIYWNREDKDNSTAKIYKGFNLTNNSLYRINISVLDSVGNVNEDTFWIISDNSTNYSINAPNTSNEWASNNFTLIFDLKADIITDINATFNYNGTNYTTTETKNSSGYFFNKTLAIPSVNVTGNQTFFWYYNISYINNEIYSNTTRNSSIYISSVSLNTTCTSPRKVLVNFTLKDEETQTTITTGARRIDVDLYLINPLNESQYKVFNGSGINVSSYAICYENISLEGFKINSTVSFESDTRVVENYYIDYMNITNSNVPNNISLYDLLTTDSTSFLVTYQDENYLYSPEVFITLMRRYIAEDTFKTVEMGKTDSGGQTRLHLTTEDVIYKIQVTKTGVLLLETEEFQAICQTTPCQINLNSFGTVTPPYNYTNPLNLSYSLTTNSSTRTATLDFTTLDGSTANVVMNITKLQDELNETVCSKSLSSSAGTITCNVSPSLTNSTYLIIISKDGSFISQEFLDLNQRVEFGTTGVILGALMVLSMTLMAVSTGGIGTLIFFIIGLLGAIGLSLINIEYGTLIYIIVAVVILIFKFSKKEE